MGSKKQKLPRAVRLRYYLKRSLQVAAVLLLLAVLAFGLALSTLRNEYAWRQYVFPKFFGPYWNTSLMWDSFQPQVFPPGIQITKLVLKEPGDNGRNVLTIDEFSLQFGWRLSSEAVTIRLLKSVNMEVNYHVDQDGTTNLDKALYRLYEGMPIKPPGRVEDVAYPNERILPEIRLEDFLFDGLKVNYSNLATPELPTTFVYTLKRPVKMRLSELEQEFSAGRLDNFLALEATGDFKATVGEIAWEGDSTLNLVAEELARFPRNKVKLSLAVGTNEAVRDVLLLSTTLPMDRVPVRPAGTRYEDLNISLQRGEDVEYFSVRNGLYDPLVGTLQLPMKLTAKPHYFIELYKGFLARDVEAAWMENIRNQPWYGTFGSSDSPVRLNSDVLIKGTGVGQMAIVDDREYVPLDLETSGTLQVTDLPLPDDVVFVEQVMGSPPRGTITWDWKSSASEKDKRAGLWTRLSLTPIDNDSRGVGYTVMLSDPDNEDEKFTFNPWAVEAVRLMTLGMEHPSIPSEPPPAYTTYEESMGEFYRYGEKWVRLLDFFELGPVKLKQQFKIDTPEIILAVIQPFFSDPESVDFADIAFSIAKYPDGKPTEWKGDLQIDSIRLKDVRGEFRVQGDMDLAQTGSILNANDFTLSLVRFDEEDGVTTFTLGLPTAESRPDLVTEVPYLDLATGHGLIEIVIDTLNRQIVELVLRIQTYGLSEQLAQPFYQQILDLFGFNPDDPMAKGEAEVYLGIVIDETLKVATQLQVRNIPASNFLQSQGARTVAGESFDATLRQSAELDYRQQLLIPRLFDLNLMLSGIQDPFAVLRLETSGDARFSMPALQAYAAQEAEQFEVVDVEDHLAIRQAIVGFFDRLLRLRSTLKQGQATVILDVPDFRLEQFGETLRSSGIPIETALLNMRMIAGLQEGDRTSESLADGSFSFSNLRLTGMEEPLPELSGTMDIYREGTTILIRDLSTSIQPDPAFPPTAIRFNGALKTDSLDSSWTLMLEQINGPILNLLRSFENSGIGDAAAVMARIPLGSLAALAGDKGSVDLRFDARTDSRQDLVELKATQSGYDLLVFPAWLRPLSFQLVQALEYRPGKPLALSRLEGDVREADTDTPLILLKLDNPISLGKGSNRPSTVKLEARKDLAEISERLADFPLPFFDRTITSGLIAGSIEVLFPEGGFSTQADGADDFDNRLRLSLTDIQLKDFESTIDAEIAGDFRRRDAEFTLDRFDVVTHVGDEHAGSMKLEAAYNSETDLASAAWELERFRPLILKAMPKAWHPWMGQDTATLDMSARISGKPMQKSGDLDFTMALRRFGLPEMEIPGAGPFKHPPLHMDVSMRSTVNGNSSLVGLDQFKLLIASGGEVADLPRLAPLPGDVTPVISLSMISPLIYDYALGLISPESLDGAGVRALLGPINLDDYGLLVYQYFGLPLNGGRLMGDFTAQAVGQGDNSTNNLQAMMSVSEGRWQSADGTSNPVDLRLFLNAVAHERQVRLKEFEMRIDHPNDEKHPFDQMVLGGFYEYDPIEDQQAMELQINSQALHIDRLLKYLADYQVSVEQRAKQQAPVSIVETIADTPTTSTLAGLPANFSGSVNGRLENLTFRDLAFPSITFDADYIEGVTRIHEFRSNLEEGEITLGGFWDPTQVKPAWELNASVKQLEAAPWADSFGTPDIKGKIRGLISSEFSAKGLGIKPEDLRKMTLNATFELENGRLDNPYLDRVVGTESDLSADINILVRNNRALFRLDTPYNASRDFFIQGMIRDLFPEEGKLSFLRAFAEFYRTTTVGPQDVLIEMDGKMVQPRQNLFGITMETHGPIGDSDRTKYDLRSVHY